MFGARFIAQTFVSVFITMTIIYIIKKVSSKYEIPVVNTIAQGV